VGTVEELFALSLSFSGMGTVEQVFVSEGQKVNKGQLLAALNTATVQDTVDVSRASLWQAKSMLAVSEKNLADCRLYAPRAGVIAERSIEPGANAMPGMAAFKLITVDEIDAKIAVPENEIGNIFPKQESLIEATVLGGERFTGKIETKGVAVYPSGFQQVALIIIPDGRKRQVPYSPEQPENQECIEQVESQAQTVRSVGMPCQFFNDGSDNGAGMTREKCPTRK
jgi:multidrug resistance efflux pump